MTFKIIKLNVENYEHIVSDRGSNQPSLDYLLYHDKIRTSETLLHQIGAVTPQGQLVGFGLAVSGPWDPILKPGNFQLEIRVDPEWRKLGVGDAIYKDLQSFVNNHGAVILKACVGDNLPEDLAWANRRGFVNNQHVFASRLDLTQFDKSRFTGLIEKTGLSDFNFTSLAEYPQNDKWFERFMSFYYELLQDVPGVEPDYQPEIPQLKIAFKDSDNWDPTGIILVEHDKEWAAMAWAARRPDGNYYNQLTGVRKKYRGKGLGIVVKLKSIEYVQKQKSLFIYTHNDSDNRPMLDINQRLGFQPTHGVFWLSRTI
jgi:GNAT superfamily N-acetyltransferase